MIPGLLRHKSHQLQLEVNENTDKHFSHPSSQTIALVPICMQYNRLLGLFRAWIRISILLPIIWVT